MFSCNCGSFAIQTDQKVATDQIETQFICNRSVMVKQIVRDCRQNKQNKEKREKTHNHGPSYD